MEVNFYCSNVITFVCVALTKVALTSVNAATRKPFNTVPTRTVFPLMIADERPGE